MSDVRVVYLGDRISAAQALLKIPGQRLAAWIFEAGSEENHDIRVFCEKNRVFPYEVSSKRALFEALEKIGDISLGVIANFGIILSKEMLALSKNGFVNVHLGSLPEYPGRFPVRDALANNEKVLALTLHRVTEKVDSGEVLAKKQVPCGEKKSGAEILERMDRMIPDILKENLPL